MIIYEKLLWKQIQDFPLDDPSSALNFTSRLARENNWNIYFAERVTTAYKKFIFLCMVSSQQVTPSDAVDEAWHLHMTYTESYWNELCGKVLGRPLHHHPTKGGEDEGWKFFHQYDATLQLYREKFDEEPPEDIWPPAEKRFAAGNFIRIDKDAHWFIKKPKRKNLAAAVGLNLLTILVGIFTGNWAFMVITGLAAIVLLLPSTQGGISFTAGCTAGSYAGGCGGDSHSGCGGDSGCGGGCGGGCGD